MYGIFHFDASARESHAFRFEPDTLLQSRLARQTNSSAGAQDSMPWNLGTAILQGPYDLTRGAFVSGRLSNFAIRHDPPARDTTDHVSKVIELHRSIDYPDTIEV